MQTVDVVTIVAAGLAIIAVSVAGWQLRRARRQAREATMRLNAAHKVVPAAETASERAQRAAEEARGQARWAWEQVKLASSQLEQAQTEHRATTVAEEWEWAYTVTRAAQELADAGRELIRMALDTQVAPHHRVAAERHYHQASQRWQETIIKALARTSPSLEVQHQVNTFAQMQYRLHGQVLKLLRAAETDTLAEDSPLSKQVIGAGQELETVRRQLQRTISSSLTGTGPATTGQITSNDDPSPQTPQRQEPPRPGGGDHARSPHIDQQTAPPETRPTPPARQGHPEPVRPPVN